MYTPFSSLVPALSPAPAPKSVAVRTTPCRRRGPPFESCVCGCWWGACGGLEPGTVKRRVCGAEAALAGGGTRRRVELARKRVSESDSCFFFSTRPPDHRPLFLNQKGKRSIIVGCFHVCVCLVFEKEQGGSIKFGKVWEKKINAQKTAPKQQNKKRITGTRTRHRTLCLHLYQHSARPTRAPRRGATCRRRRGKTGTAAAARRRASTPARTRRTGRGRRAR